MRIGVDLGFGFVKVLNDKGDKKSFPSIIAKRADSSLKKVIGGSDDDYAITYWEDDGSGAEIEKKFYVGDAGMTNGGERRWEDKTKINVDDIKVFIATAVGLVNSKNEPVDICVGLPMSYYMEKKDELKETLKSIKAKVQISGHSGIREINCNSITVFPQGAGAYYAAMWDVNGKLKEQNMNLVTSSVGIIDIGYRTVDYLVMGKGRKGITMMENLSGSLEDDGMNIAFQEIERVMSEKLKRNIGLIEIEKALMWFGGKLEYKREEYNLIPYEESAYSDRAEQIASKLKIKWGIEGDLLSTIIITGGGGEALYPVLKNSFEQAQLQDNASFANCEGYLGVQARKILKSNK